MSTIGNSVDGRLNSSLSTNSPNNTEKQNKYNYRNYTVSTIRRPRMPTPKLCVTEKKRTYKQTLVHCIPCVLTVKPCGGETASQNRTHCVVALREVLEQAKTRVDRSRTVLPWEGWGTHRLGRAWRNIPWWGGLRYPHREWFMHSWEFREWCTKDTYISL